MIYKCKTCHFIFKRVGQPESCPNCDKTSLREATGDEQEEFLRIHPDIKNDKK